MSTGAERDTIFALSSGTPPAAIAIVRVSGPAAATALKCLAGSLPQPRRASLRTLRDAEGAELDQALLLWFPGPESATGEDLAELHLHGGRAVVAAVLAALGSQPGCRLAQAGEFTRRAFERGRIDLLQAEGLADLLFAETEAARRRAVQLAEGGLSRRVERWRAELVTLLARVEATLEFGGDDPDIAADPQLRGALCALAAELDAALAAPPAERLRDGVRVLLAGPPNAGKSTLLNALAGRDAAIVTPVAGTTRDLVEVPVILAGQPVLLIDSAGLREAADPVERIGVDRAHAAIARADLILWLGADAERPPGEHVIALVAKSDLLAERSADDGLAISAVSGFGMNRLRALLADCVSGLLRDGESGLAERQRAAVCDASAAVRCAAALDDEALVADELRQALAALDVLTGRVAVEPMLDALFAGFCIGK